MTEGHFTLPKMAIEEAREIGRLCANLEPGYPPTNPNVLVRAILKLPTRLRDVFLLNRMAGLTYSEIGLHLGIDPKAVETSLAAALVRLMRAVAASDPSSKRPERD